VLQKTLQFHTITSSFITTTTIVSPSSVVCNLWYLRLDHPNVMFPILIKFLIFVHLVMLANLIGYFLFNLIQCNFLLENLQ